MAQVEGQLTLEGFEPKSFPQFVDSAYIAEAFGMTARRVQQLTQEGVIPTSFDTGKERYDFLKVVNAYVLHLSDKLAGRNRDEDSGHDARRLKADAVLKETKAKIAEMQLAELEGTMHSAEDVKKVTSTLVFTIKGMLLALPGRLAIDVSNAKTPAEGAEIIRSEVCAVLEELSHFEYEPDVYIKIVSKREGWSERRQDESG